MQLMQLQYLLPKHGEINRISQKKSFVYLCTKPVLLTQTHKAT
jgi:hypothetical protein